jgi:hypothetical protein
MNNHPLNLGVRFLLELALVAIFAYWAWIRFDGLMKYLLSFALPILGMLIWAIFKVDGDPGKAIIAVSGWVRLIIEFVLFGAAFLMLRSLELNKLSLVFLVVAIVHYVASYDRVKWLLNN